MSGSKIIGNWAEIQTDLLDLISSKFTLYEDYVALTEVCKSWRSAAKSAAKFNEANAIPLPLLMLTPEDRAGGSTLKFYKLRTGKVLMMDHPGTTFKFKRCLSSMGWLVVTEIEGAMSLLHPLTRNQIPLLNYKTLKFSNLDPNLDPETVNQNAAYAIHKAVLSSKPSEEDYIIMILTGERYGLAFWKPGVSGWTAVEQEIDDFRDVIYHKGKFYAIHGGSGEIISYSIGNDNQITREVAGRLSFPFSFFTYLVECCGELVAVTRHYSYEFVNDCHWTNAFRVYRPLDLGNLTKWAEHTDLEGQSVFIGHNSSLSVPAEAAGIKPDCIYFTDDLFDLCEANHHGKDMGIYSLKEDVLEKHYQDYEGYEASFFCPPLWVMPSF